MVEQAGEKESSLASMAERVAPRNDATLSDGGGCFGCDSERRPWPYGPDATVLSIENYVGETLFCALCFSPEEATR